jgi:hypothetical protein
MREDQNPAEAVVVLALHVVQENVLRWMVCSTNFSWLGLRAWKWALDWWCLDPSLMHQRPCWGAPLHPMGVLTFAPLGHSLALMQTPTGIAGKMAVGESEWKMGTEGLRFAC